MIGMVAGVLTYYGVGMMEALRIDDPVGAFPVHGINGIFGTLAIGLFTTEFGVIYGAGFSQLGIQALGVLAATVFVFPVSLIMFVGIKKVFGLRVSLEIEKAGIDLFLHGIESYPEFTNGAGVGLEGFVTESVPELIAGD